MVRKNRLPRFPFDYINEKAEEYNNSKWMERNQKRATLLSIQYLFDENLNDIDTKVNKIGDPFLILDLGCGTGFSSEILIENNFRVIGIDKLPDMLLKAKEKKTRIFMKRPFFELILADINFLPIRVNSLEYIISVSVYNFITYGSQNYNEKLKVINDTARYLNQILKKNGRMVIEFYPKDEKELDIFNKSFIKNGFEGFMIKSNPNQKSGQTFLLLRNDK